MTTLCKVSFEVCDSGWQSHQSKATYSGLRMGSHKAKGEKKVHLKHHVHSASSSAFCKSHEKGGQNNVHSELHNPSA